ncbi:MprA protease, GlyGly-CTERM protein-sorting domain-containing form [Akkermansiaceae bacterium]|nr:MprA protease, GlyGly-CTERM protein-sorting domain-containing form [Akkermansiaceae bacterium]
MMINVTNGSQLNTFFVLNGADVQVDGTSSVTLGGGGNPVNLSTINLTSGSVLSFLGETPAAFTTEHLSKITVDGAAAVDGVNINIATFNGASGSQVTVIPEPSHALLLGIGGLLGFARRRRS